MKTAVLDTNIFIRHLAQDVPEQAKKATAIFDLIEKGKMRCFVSILVVNETLWVLERFYAAKREVMIPQVMKLLMMENIKIIEMKKEKLLRILQHMEKTNYDFTDLYLFYTSGAKEIMSFDKDIKKLQRS